MTPTQLLAAFAKLGLSQRGAGKWLNPDSPEAGARRVRRMVAGTADIPELLAMYLDLLVEIKKIDDSKLLARKPNILLALTQHLPPSARPYA